MCRNYILLLFITYLLFKKYDIVSSKIPKLKV